MESATKLEGEITTKLRNTKKENYLLKNADKENPNSKKNECERKFQWGRGLDQEFDLSGEFIKRECDLPSCCLNPNEEQSTIQRFYENQNVLITGSTGFIGKLLVEKLLVSCPNIGNLYLLIREKKGKTSEERFDALFKDPVFSRLHKVLPNFRKKVIAVNGDMSKPNLGLCDNDYETILKNINIIFNGAANVRFDEPLKDAVKINVRGVVESLKLAKKCESLKAFIHVSTVYSNCTILNKEITEEFYPAAYDFKKLIELTEKESNELVEKMTPSIIRPWPNTYSFTKQVAEDVIQKEGQGLPIAVFRPAIIIATYNEPIRGWSDNIYGPTGVIIGAGTGVLRVVQSDKEATANMVPVDLVVNSIIAAAWKTSTNFQDGKKNIPIYNYVSAARNPVRWGEFSYWSAVYGRNWPTVLAIWYEEFHQIKNRVLFLLLTFLLHTLPSYIADGVLLICGKKPKMVNIYKKINKFNEVMSYFSTKEWKFTDDNVLKLWKSLSPQDQKIYPFDIAEMDWDFHAQAHILGLRLYVVKDDLDTLDKGRLKWKRLQFFHRCLIAILMVVFSWLIYRLFNFASSLVSVS